MQTQTFHRPQAQSPSRRKALGRCLLLLLAGCLTQGALAGAWAADAPKTTVIEAETIKSEAGVVYRDAKASGGKVVVLKLTDDAQEVAKTSIALPAGEYEMAAYFEATPIAVLHSFKLHLKAGETDRVFGVAQVDPAPGYQRVSFRFRHQGGPLNLGASCSGVILTESVRKDNTDDEKSQGKTGADFSTMPQISAKKTTKQSEQKAADEFEIEDSPDISKLSFLDKRIALDKLEITLVRTAPSTVTMVDVDKIHYLPGETVSATARANGGPAGGKYQFVADLITEADTTQRVYSQDVALEPNAATNLAFSFKLDAAEFGHELRCSLLKDGVPVHDKSAVFGVSANVYRIGISGSAGPQNKRLMTPERAAKTMEYNKDTYANYFECFAWAPSELCKYVPDEELFWAGQLQFPGSISGFKNMFVAAHQRGIKGFSYGSVVAGGIEGFSQFQRHPLAFACNPASGTCSELISTFFLERMFHKEYSFPSRKSAESIAWTSWSSIYGEDSPEALDMLADQISRMPDSLGWDGMRWDFAPGQLAELKKRVAAKHSNFYWGYNYAVANPGSTTFLPSAQGSFEGFNEMCKDHGLLMDESVRFWSNPSFRSGNIHDLYTGLCHEANYVKRMGGLPLFMVLDGGGTHQDRTFGIFTGLSAGSRYCYYTSPADLAYGSVAKFLTRYSAFVWDDTALIANADKVVSVTVGGPSKPNAPGPFPGPWWDQSTWLRKLPDGRQQLLVNIINPPGYQCYSNRVQTPSATLHDLSVSVPTPAGAKLIRTFEVSPELFEGLVPLTPTTEGNSSKVAIPALKSWTIVAFEYGSANSDPLAYPAFTLTTPVEDAVAYAKSLKDEKLKEIQQKAQNLKMGHEEEASETQPAAAQPEPEVVNKRPVQHWNDFKKEYNIDAEVASKLKRPDDMNIKRDGTLDVHHVKGIFNWLNPIELSIGMVGGGTYDCSYINRESYRSAARGYMSDFPDKFEQLLHYDVLVLDNMHTLDLGPQRRAMINEYVRNGGSVLIFGGYYNLSRGADRNTAIGELDPVNIVQTYNLAEDNKGMPLKPAIKGFFPDDLDWSADPCAYSVDVSPLKPGVEVLATVGGHPAIVRSTFGKGRVVAFLMNVHGDYADSSMPYWKWAGYPRIIAACIKWLGEDASKVYVPPVKAAQLDPKEVSPDNLVIEASMLDTKEFTKRLRSASKNMVDKATAGAVLDCAVQFADKVDDQDLLSNIAEKAGEYVDASFAPVAKKLVRSQHPKLRRVGYQVLGLAGDKSFHPFIELGLDDTDAENQRTALLALSRLNEPAAIPRIKSYLFRGHAKLLALGVMHKLGDRGAVLDALPLYNTSLLDFIDHRCTRQAVEYGLWGPGGPRLTPSKRKEMMMQLNDLYDLEFNSNFDNRFFVNSFNDINDGELDTVTDFLSKADSYRVTQLAYGLIPKLTPAQVERFRAGLANASQPELQVLAKQIVAVKAH